MLRPNRAATLTRQLLNRVGLMVDRSHVVEDQDILEFQYVRTSGWRMRRSFLSLGVLEV